MLDYNKIEKIVQQYLEEEEEEEQYSFRGGASTEQITNVENLLNVKLPDSYYWFLKRYGSGGIAGININGIEARQNNLEDCTLVYNTKYYRENFNLDERYIVIENCGDYIMCLDTNENNNNEYPVIKHIIYGDVDIFKRKDNFYEYLLDKLIYMTE